MSSMFDRKAEDAVTAALENRIILRQIFCCLPLSDLKCCRLVNKTWSYEAVSFVKDYRGCACRISDDRKNRPCSDLLALAEIVSGMNIVPMNGVEIELGESSHLDCKSFDDRDHNLYANLMQKFPIEHLHVSWDTDFSPLSCPVVNFIMDLLHRKIMDLSTLELTALPDDFEYYFGRIWTPWLPKLTVLNIGNLYRLPSQRDLFLKIINGSPNLKKLKGHHFVSEFLTVIPEAKYATLDNFSFFVESDTVEKTCLKLAAAGPALSYLFVSAASNTERQYMRSFVYVAEKLFSSSCNTLETLSMGPPTFPLSILSFPPMVNLRTMIISADNTTPHLLHVLRATDYPKLLPVLSEIKVEVNLEFDPDHPITNLWKNEEAAQLVQLKPSTSAKSLDISLEFDLLPVVDVSQIFPNIVKLDLWGCWEQPTNLAASALYRDVWASWEYLEVVSLRRHTGALRWKFDAVFLGINSEEVESLRQYDDDSLESLNIVPVRPSVLTMLHLRKLEFEFEADPAPAEVDVDQVFLSKLTGILAFRKLARNGVEIQFLFKDPETTLRLNHLSSFVS